jgi:hypothetical protein
MYRLIGMWVLRRAYRILTADDPRPLAARLGAEGKRILVAQRSRSRFCSSA